MLNTSFLASSSNSLKINQNDAIALEELSIQSMLKGEIKMAIASNRKRGPRLYKTETKEPIQNFSHPIFKPGLVDEIRYSYRKYREMVLARGGSFWMGTNDPGSSTGEYPMRQVAVKSFYMDANPVINADYWAFRAQKKFVRSEAERKGWSWVVDLFLSNNTRKFYSVAGPVGWAAVKKAHWDAPEGPDTSLEGRWKHPVSHVSWSDARQYCQFHGKRLPTEPEWEYAARAGVTNRAYPWGDNWERQRANVWQGKWPHENNKADGHFMTSPVDAFRAQNLVGFYDLIGNVWEWTSSAYVERMVQPHLQSKLVTLKGGSYVDSVSGRVNMAVRCGQRMGRKQDYTAANVGFRCARSAPEFDQKPDARQEASDTLSNGRKYRKRKIAFHRRKEEL
ncbi:sulfatase-modifying factor 2 [Plakobranchus ocellatus]|uniref:Sulfatase-modifying factor 2 n=1 Tax=Plakobranchus ocellatus TaxID=259542 RepID=A0AAV4DM51_9GAST|nr:sulfatase-modifying factor 2 [Plakobranchus ocellatus]